MPIKVPDAASAAKKYAERGSAAGADYQAGVRGAGADWLAQTTAAEGSYEAGVTEAIGRKAFARGVTEAGGAKYSTKASTIGAQRFPQGVREAQGDFSRGVEPYLETIRGITLSPRRPKGDPSNYRRSQEVGEALRRRKVGG